MLGLAVVGVNWMMVLVLCPVGKPLPLVLEIFLVPALPAEERVPVVVVVLEVVVVGVPKRGTKKKK